MDEMSSNFGTWFRGRFHTTFGHYFRDCMASCWKGHICPFSLFHQFFHFLWSNCTLGLLLNTCPKFGGFQPCCFRKGHEGKCVPFGREAALLTNNGEFVLGLVHLCGKCRYVCPRAFCFEKGQNVPFMKEAIKLTSDWCFVFRARWKFVPRHNHCPVAFCFQKGHIVSLWNSPVSLECPFPE